MELELCFEALVQHLATRAGESRFLDFLDFQCLTTEFELAKEF
jgi:hypothetical protein